MGVGLAIASVASAAYGGYTAKKSSDENKDALRAAEAAEAEAQSKVDTASKEAIRAQGGGSSAQLQPGDRSIYSSLLGG